MQILGSPYEKASDASFKNNNIDTATCVFSMPFHCLEDLSFFENFPEEMKFFLEKIHQIFHMVEDC